MLLTIAVFVGFGVSEVGVLSFKEGGSIFSTLIVSDIGEPAQASFTLILFVTFIVAVFTASTDIPRDVDSRMVMLILAKPVSRWEYLLGKFVGVSGVCLLFFALSFLAATVAHFAKSGSLYPVALVVRQMLLGLAIFPFVAIALSVSTFFSEISSMIVTVSYLVFSVFVASAGVLVEMLPRSLYAGDFVYPVYYLFPNFLYYFNSFHIFGLVSLGLLFYTLSTTAVFLCLAFFRLKVMDMV
jgi:ABC-type transport system involved in multi-copper enzyme maturation permease subunit